MKLDIEILPVERFEVKINGTSIGEFEKKSDWEGMVKMQNSRGTIIASDESNFIDNLFNDLSGKEKQSSFSVVKISPSLIPTEDS